MADLRRGGEGSLRAVETVLRGVGGRAVLLRMPAPAAGGDEAEQLGLAAVGFDDVELAPCVWRKSGELTVSAIAVERIVGALEFDSAAVLFKTAAGVVVDGVVFEVSSFGGVDVDGVAVCYRVGLKRL